MINGKKNHEFVLEMLSDKRVHMSREFLDAGLIEYRQPIYKLRQSGYDIESVVVAGHPGFVLIGKKLNIPGDLFENQNAAA